MTTLRKGMRVLVVEGPDKGQRGEVLELWRGYDEETKTTGKRVEIKIGCDADGDALTLTTRVAWVREVR